MIGCCWIFDCGWEGHQQSRLIPNSPNARTHYPLLIHGGCCQHTCICTTQYIYIVLYIYMYVGNILRVLREDNECVRWDCLGLAGIADALPSHSQKSNNSRSFARTSQNSGMLLFFFNKICFNWVQLRLALTGVIPRVSSNLFWRFVGVSF